MMRALLITFAVASGVAIVAGIGVAALHPTRIERAERLQSGPRVTRDFPWAGTPSLQISVPAEVVYTQGPIARMTITGPSPVLDAIEVTDGEIRLKEGCHIMRRFWFSREQRQGHDNPICDSLNFDDQVLKIAIAGPSTERFDLSGAATLDIQSYDRPTLKLDVSGAGKLSAAGKTQKLEADLSGATEADLSNLKATDASLDISGVGHAKLNATGDVSVDISGAGAVELLTKPTHLSQQISGAGHISQP